MPRYHDIPEDDPRQYYDTYGQSGGGGSSGGGGGGGRSGGGGCSCSFIIITIAIVCILAAIENIPQEFLGYFKELFDLVSKGFGWLVELF